MPPKGASGTRDVTSDNAYRIVDKSLTYPEKHQESAFDDEEELANGSSPSWRNRKPPKANGTYGHSAATSGGEGDTEEDDVQVLSTVHGEDPLHIKSGSFHDNHDAVSGSFRHVLRELQTSSELQSVIFIAVVMEAALVISTFVAGENSVFPKQHKQYISLGVLYLLIGDLLLKVSHKAGLDSVWISRVLRPQNI